MAQAAQEQELAPIEALLTPGKGPLLPPHHHHPPPHPSAALIGWGWRLAGALEARRGL